ncbi:MAG: TonB-dependent receptor [Betaproteobacteria bacterium]|nr:TonB-dependent receptor [Betaproteobacteria bacterium]
MKRNTLHARVLGALPVCTTLFASLAITSHAQPAPEVIAVTATRTAQPLSATLDTVIVVNRADIESSGAVDLAQLLRIFANADIRATGGAGQPASIFLRGANSTHTLFLVDGLRVNSATLGSTSFEALPLDLIERVEIVKGPMSGLYGSDAIGGVVQIFTRGEKSPTLRASAGLGSAGAGSVNAGVSVQDGAAAADLNVGHRRIKDVSATRPEVAFGLHNPDRDPHEVTHGSVRAAYTFRNGETLSLSAFQSDGKTDFDAGPGGANRNRQKLSGYQLESKNELSPGWQSHLRVGRGEDELTYSGGFTGRFRTQQDQAAWINELKTVRGFMTVGLEARKETVSGSSTYVVNKRETTSVFTGYLERLGDQQVEFSLRRDEEDQFGARTTGSFTYGLWLNPSLRIFAKGGRAFRAPSFADLYLPDDPVFGPSSNPLLKPERSNSGEAGAQWKRGGNAINVTAFENRIEDLVSFVFGSGPRNIRKAKIRGVEADIATLFMGANIRASVTVQRPKDEDTGFRLRSRAKQFGSLHVTRSWGEWLGGVSVIATGERFDSANETAASRMGGYAIVNANIRYRVNPRWDVALALSNLGDKRYELARGYSTPGREALLTVRFNAK